VQVRLAARVLSLLLLLLLRLPRLLLLLQGWHVRVGGLLLRLRLLAGPAGIQGQAAQGLYQDHMLVPACHSPLQRLMLAPQLRVDSQQLLVLLLLLLGLLLQGSHLADNTCTRRQKHMQMQGVRKAALARGGDSRTCHISTSNGLSAASRPLPAPTMRSHSPVAFCAHRSGGGHAAGQQQSSA
jgi:hypothetical protein